MVAQILLLIVLSTTAILLAAGIIIDEINRKPSWGFTIPMANQRITWAGAGYNGIWEGGKGK